MNKIYKLAFFSYTILFQILCFLLLIFFGILADENVKFEKFAKVYTLGIEYNYNFLFYFVIFIFILTLILQGILAINFVKSSLKKDLRNLK